MTAREMAATMGWLSVGLRTIRISYRTCFFGLETKGVAKGNGCRKALPSALMLPKTVEPSCRASSVNA